jgi:hypothetical protein
MFKATTLQTDKEDGTAPGSVSPVSIEMAKQAEREAQATIASIGQNVIAQALNSHRFLAPIERRCVCWRPIGG